MRVITILTILLISSLGLNAQNLNVEIEVTDPGLTWPWNWDMDSNQDKLVAVNENGTINIRQNGTWENIEVDPDDFSFEPRGVALDENGTIWFTTTEHGLWTYDNGNLINYNTSNSFLPVDELRNLAIKNEILWISTDNLGIIRHDLNTNTTNYYNEAQTADLKSDANLDPFIDEDENVYFSQRECFTKIAPDLTWENEDMRTHISGGRVCDVFIVSPTEIWLAMDGGVVLFDGTDYNIILQNQWDDHLRIFKDSRGNIWTSKISTINGDGITVIHDNVPYFFSSDDNPNIPRQVFEFTEFQDTVMAVGTIGNSIAKFVFEEPSATESLVAESIDVFPNPAQNEITIDDSFKERVSKWTINSIDGSTILQGNYIHNSIDVSMLRSGMYILNLHTEKGILSKKITINSKL